MAWESLRRRIFGSADESTDWKISVDAKQAI
jgi:hypothetical protein